MKKAPNQHLPVISTGQGHGHAAPGELVRLGNRRRPGLACLCPIHPGAVLWAAVFRGSAQAISAQDYIAREAPGVETLRFDATGRLVQRSRVAPRRTQATAEQVWRIRLMWLDGRAHLA
jgi:hypothetical protein